ncbi:IS30-like element ISBlo4 family transposase [Neomicrococcus lactis]|uniref:IS30 family transposase n=2 Tax=Neomicrococcus TaxID=1868332 RepID=A0A7W8YCW0_9MICC|nr:IS30 family transposase [Neomicrococcus lactis]MBB5598459.1 IS30 family transposase [Neomicrococcus lactis]MBB5599177.1 IS30 family transposase [Neomicrococcus lactis]
MSVFSENRLTRSLRSRGARITVEEKQRFAVVLGQTGRVKDAAQVIGISLPTAYQLARKYGWGSSGPGSIGRSRSKYTPEQKAAFFAAFEKHQNVSKAAGEVNIPYPTCYLWAAEAGLKTIRRGARQREEFVRLRAQGMSRREATELVGIHPSTAKDWDNGVRKNGNGRVYPDGRVVNYKSGVTTYTHIAGQHQTSASPSLRALEQQIDARFLSMTEREEIYAMTVAGHSYRQIAVKLQRSPSTISREVRRNCSIGGAYYPHTAHRQAVARRSRPKEAKLARPGRLRDYVAYGLRLGWSPEQVCRRMVADHPDDLEMQVCQETVYQSIYLQARGGLKREVTQALRSGRARRKPQKKIDERQPRFRDGMINISERPATVEDRAVPGHWEGDLIMGAGNLSAIGTLVERTTRFVMLVHLPRDHTAQTVRDGLINTMLKLPEALRGSLTWDQGIEMALHKSFSAATDMDVYFCDPHSPWQRGSNENTNGLLRQYFPKSTDLSQYGPEDLEQVAILLNGRPRKSLDWKTPAERLHELLSEP